MARQAGEEGRIASLEGFVRQFLGTAVGDTKATVAGSVLAQLRRLYGITMSRLAFVSRYCYPPPLDVVVRSSYVDQPPAAILWPIGRFYARSCKWTSENSSSTHSTE